MADPDTIKRLEIAIVDLTFDDGWNLPHAGTSIPLRYWAHFHYKAPLQDNTELWTLFVEPSVKPVANQKHYSAKIFFMAPSAPHDCLHEGDELTLYIGEIEKARGIVKNVVKNENQKE